VIECQADSATAPQVAVHHKPNLHRKYELGVEHRNEILVSPRESDLTGTNTQAGAQSGELREVAIGTKREHIAGERHAHALE
jgi:hypothetical protein